MVTRSQVLLVAAAVAVGGLLWVGAKPFAPPPAAADGFAVSGPFTHGNLTVFLLHGPDAERSRPVLGLDEALARQCAVVHETGSVNELAVENTSEEDDLLLLSGDIVKGGRQDRVLQATMILPPKSGRVPVRSFCVEQSRWKKRGGEDDTRFAANPGQVAGKELKLAVQFAGDQGAVWANVRDQQGKLSGNVGTTVNSAASPTSLQLALENDKLQAQVTTIREAIAGKVGDPAGVVGFVTVVNGQVTGAEAFASHALFRKAWAKAVNAAAVEAVAARPNGTFTEMTPAGVRSFLTRAEQEAKAERMEAVAAMTADDLGGQTEQFRGRGSSTRESFLRASGGTNPTGASAYSSLPSPAGMQSNVSVETAGGPAIVMDATRLNLNFSGQQGQVYANPQSVRLGNIRGGYPAPPAPSPAGANTAVVEYREPGNGAVIHKSFLVK